MGYDASVFLFVLSPVIMFYHRGLAFRCSAYRKTRVTTIALIAGVFIADAMFVIKARYGARSPYYMGGNQLITLSGGVLSRLSNNIL